MRLRRETGDFSIRVEIQAGQQVPVPSTLSTGLSAEDFIGVVVNNKGVLQVVSKAVPSESNVFFETENCAFNYESETGELSIVAGDPGDDPIG